MPSYFQTHYSSFHLEPSTGLGFRKCQLGATWAVKSHFTHSNGPALISMPTGSGKTALMMSLAFELKAQKVLIISPSKVIRDQIANEFTSLKILYDIGVLAADFTNVPRVKSNKKVCNQLSSWEGLINNYDVVVGTPKTLSPEEEDVVPPPEPSFDLVIFDEAHHAPAKTWNSLIATFKNSKIILLTATPFRSDKKRIRAKLVYHYSISNAIAEGIYRVVDFVPVDTSLNQDRKDELLCEQAITKFQEEKQISNDTTILIKTETIKEAEELKVLYTRKGLNVDTIHTDKSDFQNNTIIENCRQDAVDGIICVGMVGEGLDIPQLKIAVLHSIPRTLPFTIQFIGRVSRVNNKQIGNALLIADPSYVKGEVRKLYKYDRGWHELIPSLVDRNVSGSTLTNDMEESLLNPLDIDSDVLEPFYSARIYRTTEAFAYKDSFAKNLNSDIEILLIEQERDNHPLIIISKTENEPAWGKNMTLLYNKYDLHIFYKIGTFLFEYTTSDFTCNAIKKELIPEGTISRANYNVIKKGLRDARGDKYFMIGLANSTGVGKSNPKYKMYLGKEVQASLRISDGRVFTAGHALTKISDDETRGIALDNSRIWAIKRDSVKNYQNWCNYVYDLISQEADSSIPQMDMLATTQIATIIEEEPAAIIFDDSMFDSAITVIEVNGTRIQNPNPIIKNISKVDDKIITCNLSISEDVDDIELLFKVDEGEFWSVSPDLDVNLLIDSGNTEPYKAILSNFLTNYPPLIVFPSGKTMRKNLLITTRISDSRFPEYLIQSKIWGNMDMRRESREPRPGYDFNVQDKCIDLIKQFMLPNDFLIIDDRANEIADVIRISPNEMTIEFFHCKFKVSDGKNPGANLLDIKELFEQGVRNENWIYSSNLIVRLIDRIEGNSELINGTLDQLRALNDQFQITQWSYKIILVQPGLSKSSVLSANERSNVEKLLVTLYDRTKAINAELVVWMSE